MVPTLKAEFRKLITVRSTYLLVLLAIFMSGLFTYLGTGPEIKQEEPAPATAKQQSEDSPKPPIKTIVNRNLAKEKLISNMHDAIPVVSLLIAVVVVLLMGHEYRHNTITYTLTASNSRSKVLFSKIIVGAIFTVVAVALVLIVVIAATYAAISFKDLNLPAQDYNWAYIFGRLIGYALGISLIGLAVMTLVRNLTAGVVALFLLPIINNIAAAILAIRHIEASKFLPFSALNRINDLLADYAPQAAQHKSDDLILLPATLLGATAVLAVYLVAIWAVSWYLFIHRDAT